MSEEGTLEDQLRAIDAALDALSIPERVRALVPRSFADAEGQAWFGVAMACSGAGPARVFVESRRDTRLTPAAAWVAMPSHLTPKEGGLVSMVTDGTPEGTSIMRLAGAPHEDDVGRMVMGSWHDHEAPPDALIVTPGEVPAHTPPDLARRAAPYSNLPGLWLVREQEGRLHGLLRVLESQDDAPAAAVIEPLPNAAIPAILRGVASDLVAAKHRLGPVFWWVDADGEEHIALWTRPIRPSHIQERPPAPADDLRRWWHVSDTSDRLVQFTLDFRAAPCRQACRFCPESWNQEPDRSAQDYDAAELVQHFVAALAEHPQPHVYFCAGDVIRSKALFAILDATRDAGRTLTLSTPGAELADDALVARLAAYPVDFDLTWLADDDATWSALVGRDDIPGQVRAGLRNLRARGLPVTVSVVVTAINEGRLLPTLRQLRDAEGFSRVLLRGFFPDAKDTPPDYLSLYPSWAALSRTLDALATDAATMEVSLSNVPPCQLQPAAVEKLRIRLDQAENTHGTPAPHSECDACVFAERCVRIPPSYPADREHLPRSAARAAQVARVLQPNTPP